MKKIERAILSVSDKTGLVELGEALKRHGVAIYSTGGTLKTLRENGIDAESIGSYTGFPEILDGRVKTLHPHIHGGILARRSVEEHQKSLTEHNILTFDLVCINLYPFEQVIKNENVDFEDAIENIDIGGPTMIRSAAKNYEDVAVVIDPSQYGGLIQRLDRENGSLSKEYRFELMIKAFQRTGAYDAVISAYLSQIQGDEFPETVNISLRKEQTLRYGENPHQEGAFYVPALVENLPWKKLHGKELSYNNLLDMDAAIRVAADFREPVCAIFKHTNPCGVSMGSSQKENLERAMATDPVSYFGGIVSFNTEVQKPEAELLAKQFLEIIVAPSFSKEAFEILSQKKNIRLVEVASLKDLSSKGHNIKTSSFGWLIQQNDAKIVDKSMLKVVSKKQPTDEEIAEMLFGFQLVKYVKSNAILFSRNKMTLGIGAGQMSRVDSIQFAIEKAHKAELSLQGSYMASDAFFPFRDGVDLAIEAGVKGIIQPGGSIRDEESIQAADEAGIVMVTTGIRHFRHG